MMYTIEMVIYNGKTPVYMVNVFSDGVNNYKEIVLGKHGMKKKNLNVQKGRGRGPGEKVKGLTKNPQRISQTDSSMVIT